MNFSAEKFLGEFDQSWAVDLEIRSTRIVFVSSLRDTRSFFMQTGQFMCWNIANYIKSVIYRVCLVIEY